MNYYIQLRKCEFLRSEVFVYIVLQASHKQLTLENANERVKLRIPCSIKRQDPIPRIDILKQF